MIGNISTNLGGRIEIANGTSAMSGLLPANALTMRVFAGSVVRRRLSVERTITFRRFTWLGSDARRATMPAPFIMPVMMVVPMWTSSHRYSVEHQKGGCNETRREQL